MKREDTGARQITLTADSSGPAAVHRGRNRFLPVGLETWNWTDELDKEIQSCEVHLHNSQCFIKTSQS